MKKLILLFLCIAVIFTAAACKKTPPPTEESTPPAEEKNTKPSGETPPSVPPASSDTPAPPSGPTEYERFAEILPGQWTCFEPMMSDVTCILDISADGKFIAEFTELDIDYTVASHAGRIAEQWMDSEVDIDIPDLLSFDIVGDQYVPGGDYSFELTLHNGSYVLTFYQASNGDGIFTEHFSYGPIFFYKPAPDAGTPVSAPRKNQTFEAVFWGIDNEQGLIWLEHTDELAASSFKRKITETTQYTMAPDIVFNTDTYDLYQSALYTTTTNDAGEVTRFEPLGMLDSTALYQAYMDSREWQTVSGEYGGGEPFIEYPLEISAYSIIDFDGDGTDELWLCAYDDSLIMRRGVSVFCAITVGEVRPVVSCYLTGGTIGGDEVFALYDTETERHVIAVHGYSSGWGGFFDQTDIYDYSAGKLLPITSFSVSREDADSDEILETDGIEVSKEQYDEGLSRFADPTDTDFVFYFH